MQLRRRASRSSNVSALALLCYTVDGIATIVAVVQKWCV